MRSHESRSRTRGVQAAAPSRAASQVPPSEATLRSYTLIRLFKPTDTARQPRNLGSGALCPISEGAHPADPRRAAGPRRERAHPSVQTRTQPPARHHHAGSPTAAQVHDPGVSYGPSGFWLRREHLSGLQRSISTRQEAPACLECVCCHETAIPPGTTAAAFTQAEAHSYHPAKFSKFRLLSTRRWG